MISVLIRTQNRPDYLQDAIQSVKDQNYRPLELIVVNDGGTSVQEQVAAQLEDADITWRYHDLTPAQGRSAAANMALAMANGQAVMFLDDDDWIAKDHIARLAKVLFASETLVGVYSDTACVYRNDVDNIIKTFDIEYDANRLAYENFLPIHAVLFKRQAVIEGGCRFDEGLELYEDWHFWLQVAALGGLRRVPGVSAFYSLDISGIGVQSDADLSAAKTLFLHKALPIMTDAQINYISHAAIALQSANDIVDQLAQECDQKTLEIARQQTHLERWEALDEQRNEQLNMLQNKLMDQLEKSHQLQHTLHDIHYEKEQNSGQIALHITQLEAQVAEQNATLQQLNAQSERLSGLVGELLQQQQTSRFQKTLVASLRLMGKVKRKSKTLMYLLKQGEYHAVKEQLMVNARKLLPAQAAPVLPAAISHPTHLTIVTVPHTLYVAKMICKVLKEFGLSASIQDQNTRGYDDSLHIVICPQIYDHLPDYYIAFQMEQSVSSRWFDDTYIQRLEHSLAIMDYSHRNIEYLQEDAGLSYKQIYYTPVSNFNVGDAAAPPSDKDHDIVFYGDVNNERRRAFIDALSQEFSVLTISNTFGDELYQQLKRAHVVVNIHYYENALLETTRIHECLSLGLRVVSESSSDIQEHDALADFVRFTEIGNIAAMVTVVKEELARARGCTEPHIPPEDLYQFRYYFGRMLVALSIIDINTFDKVPSILAEADLAQGLGLSLPETHDRYHPFKLEHPDKKIFSGMRHAAGWKGCALSYRYMARQALAHKHETLEVWEDDVVFEADKYAQWCHAKAFFTAHLERFDLLSGLIADVAEDTEILDVIKTEDGYQYAVINKITSTVCNVYGQKPLKLMATWDITDDDVQTNTIDRHLQRNSLVALVPIPFLATHRPEKESTLWGFRNVTYDEMIQASEARLLAKVEAFLNKQHK